EVRIECRGFSIGAWDIPPFALHSGEAMTLLMPGRPQLDWDAVISALTGKRPIPEVTIHGCVLHPVLAVSSLGWFRRFQKLTPFDWLKKNTALADEEIHRVLSKHGLKASIPLNAYAGTPKTLLGLEAAYAQGPKAIVFSQIPLDPLGFSKVFETINGHLPTCAALYLAGPVFHQG